MKNKRAILDTSALAAILRRKDEFHRWANAEVDKIVAPMLTCEAVLSETYFILRDIPGARRVISEMSEKSIFVVAFDYEEQKTYISKLLEKYADVPMSFADACLVRMSELYPNSAVFTLDGDFKIYRRNGRQPIPLISPEK